MVILFASSCLISMIPVEGLRSNAETSQVVVSTLVRSRPPRPAWFWTVTVAEGVEDVMEFRFELGPMDWPRMVQVWTVFGTGIQSETKVVAPTGSTLNWVKGSEVEARPMTRSPR